MVQYCRLCHGRMRQDIVILFQAFYLLCIGFHDGEMWVKTHLTMIYFTFCDNFPHFLF